VVAVDAPSAGELVSELAAQADTLEPRPWTGGRFLRPYGSQYRRDVGGFLLPYGSQYRGNIGGFLRPYGSQYQSVVVAVDGPSAGEVVSDLAAQACTLLHPRPSRLCIACAPRRLTRRILRLREIPSGTVLNLKTTA
jgi:hypothetical protein